VKYLITLSDCYVYLVIK